MAIQNISSVLCSSDVVYLFTNLVALLCTFPITEEKDLGILIDDKLKFQQHINQQKNKANQRLGMIKRSFSYMDKEMFLIMSALSLLY
jgi:hypothetical protein